MEQVIEVGRGWAMHRGECETELAGLVDQSIDHVITDPPYSERVHGKSRAGARKTPLLDGNGKMSRCAIDREVDFGFAHLTPETMDVTSQHFARLAKRWTLAFCDVESSHLWAGALTGHGLDYCRTGAWIKVGATPQFTGDRPGVGFEAIVIAHPKGRKKWNGGGSLGVWTHLTAIDRGQANIDKRSHPTQKPLSLMLQLIELFTDPGDLILDPFAGSGTTGVAALRLGRQFIGIERDEKFFRIATERLHAEENDTSVAAARAGQLPLMGAAR